jgi:hypothetical protein
VIFRGTGTKEVAAAKRIATQIIESFWGDAGRGAELLKLTLTCLKHSADIAAYDPLQIDFTVAS